MKLSMRAPLNRGYSSFVSSDGKEMASAEKAGLCATCQHCTRVESSHGSIFFLCELSRTDARYARYPRLPVLKCEGYQRRADAER